MTLVPLTEASQTLGLKPSTLRWQIRNKRLAAQKLGGEWYVTPEEIRRYAKEVQKRAA